MESNDRNDFICVIIIKLCHNTEEKKKDEVNSEALFLCSPSLVRLKDSACDAECWGITASAWFVAFIFTWVICRASVFNIGE